MSAEERDSDGRFWSHIEQTFCDPLTPTWDETSEEEA